MIGNDAEILAKLVTASEKEILRAIDPAYDTAFTRKALIVRKIGEGNQFDEVTTRDRTGQGAVIGGKTVSNLGSGSSVSKDIYPQKKIIDGFEVSAKDLKGDPRLNARDVEICLSNIARKEDQVTINGSAAEGITGLVAQAQANPNGKIVAAGAAGNDVNNIGAWDGSDPSMDPYADLLAAIERISNRYKPVWLGGRRADLLKLWALDSERKPYYYMSSGLFGRRPEDNPWDTWMLSTDLFTAGKVYVGVKNAEAAELVVSENPTPIAYPMREGEVYPVEVREYVRQQLYDTQAFVEVDIT